MMERETSRIKLYIVEEQELYRHMYSVLQSGTHFQLLGISSNGNKEDFRRLLAAQPDVLLMGAKKLTPTIFEELEEVRLNHPKTGVVLLLTFLSSEEAMQLRKLLQKGKAGIALYLKQSLDDLSQLYTVIRAVSHGQFILDPAIASSMFMEKSDYSFLKTLTDREVEILGLLARGYTNYAIGQALFIDVKTVEHHLNNIYSKLKGSTDFDQKHPRVNVARLYLETTGELVPVNPKTSVPLYPDHKGGKERRQFSY